MTKEQINEAITAAAKAHGFETKPGTMNWTVDIISDELNFIFTMKETEDTDWAVVKATHKVDYRVTVSASVRKMGGNPTVEELLKTADEIRRGAELVAEIQTMALTWTETF